MYGSERNVSPGLARARLVRMTINRIRILDDLCQCYSDLASANGTFEDPESPLGFLRPEKDRSHRTVDEFMQYAASCANRAAACVVSCHIKISSLAY